MKWIKKGMERSTKRMDEHDREIAAVKSRQTWYTGLVAGVCTALGFGGANLLKPWQ